MSDTTNPSPASTPTGEIPVNPSISDPTWLFRFSGLVDQVRDAAHFFIEAEVTERDALKPLAEKYLELRSELPVVLGEIEAPLTGKWGYEIDPESVSAAGLFAAAAMLARWCDLLYQTPTFVTQQKIALVSAQKASLEIEEVMRSASQSALQATSPSNERTGNYL